MAKRFSDSQLWNKDWFLNLSLKQKLLVKYIFDNCDCAGVYEISYRTLNYIFDEEITKEDFLNIKQVKFVAENKIFIEDFIKFQYGIETSELNEKYSVHKGIIKKLNKINYFKTLTQPFANSTSEELQDKVKDKDKDIVSHNEEKEKNKKEKEKIIEKLFATKSKNPDLVYNQEIDKVFKIYKKECPDLIAVVFEDRDLSFRQEMLEFLTLIRWDFSYFAKLCKKANQLKFIVNKRIDIKALIRNHTRIYSGYYLEERKEAQTEKQKDLEEYLHEKIRQKDMEAMNEQY